MSAQQACDGVSIEGLEVDCIVGWHEHERDRQQRLIVDVQLTLDVERAAAEDQLAHTVDYGLVLTQVVFILKVGRFRLLEAAAQTICRALLLAPVDGELRGPIASIELTLRKPNALNGHGVPSLRVQRDSPAIGVRHESKPFGAVDVIRETGEAGFYRAQIAAGSRLGLKSDRQSADAELTLSSGLSCLGKATAPGLVRQWPACSEYYYDNTTDKTQSLLCCGRPSMDASNIAAMTDAAVVAVQPRDVWDL